MTIGPEGMLSPWSSCLVKKTLLRDEHKRVLGYLAARDFAFAPSNFIERAAEMNCAGAFADVSLPGNRRAQRVITFENSRDLPKTFESSAVTCRQFIARDAVELPG